VIVPDDIEAYAESASTPAPDWLAALDAEARAELPFPQMLSGNVVGRLLQALIWASGATRVLEIGTYAGYSALAMAMALPEDGTIVSCELEPDRAAWAQRHVDASPYAARVRIEVGPALETVERLPGPWDLVFVDADKTGYPGYVDAILPKLTPRGLVVLDNTLRGGDVLAPAAGDEGTRVIAELNARLAADPALVTTLLTVRDGVTLVRRAA
jgi:caffeoyl-CoA O-methyltransferase